MPARSKLPSWLEHLESDSEYMDTVYCALELRNRARKAMCNKRTAPIHTDLISAMNARVAQSFVQRKRSAFSGEHANRVTNWHRNRFTAVVPFDGTRVVFADRSKELDYVNASWLTEPAYEGSLGRQWIAAQGPTDQTVHDFWSMFLEPLTDLSRTSRPTPTAIVMLTGCHENGQEKCARYWPDEIGASMTVTHLVPRENGCAPKQVSGRPPKTNWVQGPLPPITVTWLWSQPSSFEDAAANRGWRYNRFRVETYKEGVNGGAGAKILRLVDHFEYKDWPDSGVPRSISGFLRFVRFVLGKLPAQRSSAVIHCSAGVGRTGAFGAATWLVNFVKLTIRSDGSVEMSKDRMQALELASLASPLGPLERLKMPRQGRTRHSSKGSSRTAASPRDTPGSHDPASIPLPDSRSSSRATSRSSHRSSGADRWRSSSNSSDASGTTSIRYERLPFDPIMAFIDILRDQRPHMVQTQEQIRLIYKVCKLVWIHSAGLPEESLSSRSISSASSVSSKASTALSVPRPDSLKSSSQR